MDFYEEIANYYDEIFPLKKDTLNFLQDSFTNKQKILDIACATGVYTNALNNAHHEVTGIDLNEKMISLAKIKYPKSGFKVMNMLDINECQVYNGIFCIGNSLVHLDNDELKRILKIIYQALANNGVFVLQIINYDRIIKMNIDHLPTIKNEKIEFIRNYEIQADKISFNTTLIVENKVLENTTNLFPIKTEDLINSLKYSGFKDVKTYDGFTESSFDIDNSMSLVIRAIK